MGFKNEFLSDSEVFKDPILNPQKCGAIAIENNFILRKEKRLDLLDRDSFKTKNTRSRIFFKLNLNFCNKLKILITMAYKIFMNSVLF